MACENTWREKLGFPPRHAKVIEAPFAGSTPKGPEKQDECNRAEKFTTVCSARPTASKKLMPDAGTGDRPLLRAVGLNPKIISHKFHHPSAPSFACTTRGKRQITSSLKKFWTASRSVFDAALERVQQFLGEAVTKEYRKKAEPKEAW